MQPVARRILLAAPKAWVQKGATSSSCAHCRALHASAAAAGALTSKPYAFKARSWELKRTETVDVMDAVGSSITMEARGNEVLRIQPRLNEEINEEWISDKTRFAYDGLKRQRLTQPLLPNEKDGALEPVDWDIALRSVAKDLTRAANGGAKPTVGVAVGPLADAEAIVSVGDCVRTLASAGLVEPAAPGASAAGQGAAPHHYCFNAGIDGIERAAVSLLVGTTPRKEATLVNARLRKMFLRDAVEVASIGPAADLTFPTQHLGVTLKTFFDVAAGKHPWCEKLRNARAPMVVLGASLLPGAGNAQAAQVQAAVQQLVRHTALQRPNWSGVCWLHGEASGVAARALTEGIGLVDTGAESVGAEGGGKRAPLDVLLSVGNLEDATYRALWERGAVTAATRIVQIAHHPDAATEELGPQTTVLPGAAYSEKRATYVNTEGRAQQTRVVLAPPLEAREDWQVGRALLAWCAEFAELPDSATAAVDYTDGTEMQARLERDLPAAAPGARDKFARSPFASGMDAVAEAADGAAAATGAAVAPLQGTVGEYFATNAVARASATMATCAANFEAGAVRDDAGRTSFVDAWHERRRDNARQENEIGTADAPNAAVAEDAEPLKYAQV